MNDLDNQLNQLSISKKTGFVTRSQKNMPQLCVEDHFLRLSNTDDVQEQNGHIVKWRCTYQNYSFKCQTFGCMIGQSYDIIDSEGVHIEAPNTKKLTKLEYRRKLKDIASVSEEPPRKLVVKTKGQILMSNEELACASSYDADRQFILRSQKESKPEYPKEPACLAEISIPDFLIY